MFEQLLLSREDVNKKQLFALASHDIEFIMDDIFQNPLTYVRAVIIIITGGEKMRINTRFPVAVHIMALIALQGETAATSEMMALSVGNHPVVVRQIMSSLKKAGLIETQNGVPGGHLAKPPEEITLCDIYRAVKTAEDAPLFDLHPHPNPQCPVGNNIKAALEEPLLHAQTAMENALKEHTLLDITQFIVEKYNVQTQESSYQEEHYAGL